jgi:hypothetical protein
VNAVPGGDIIITDPQYFSNVDAAAAKMPDIRADDLEIIGGRVVISRQIAEAISKELLGTDNIEVHLLPLFESAIQIGKIAAVKIPVNGAQFNVNRPRDILLLKVMSPSYGEFLEYVSEESDYDDGKFTLLLKGSETPYSGNINSGVEYDMLIFIKDGGKYDLDKASNGFVVDPTAIVNKKQSGNNGDDQKRGGGGGGCSAYAYLAFALIGAMPLVLKRQGK